MRPALWLAEEGSAFLRVVAELIAKDAEGAGGVAEAAGDVAGGLLIDEVSAEGFVLALHRGLGGKEEVLVRRSDYLIYSTGAHTQIVLQKQSTVNMFWSVKGRQITECKQEWPKLHTVGAMAQEGLLTDLTG
jgi:hypothetical protein